MTNITFKFAASCLLVTAIIGCGRNTEEATGESSPSIDPAAEKSPLSTESEGTDWTVSSDMNVPADQLATDENLAAVLGASDIPYPLYPNGSKYRIGGENGLKIVLFQTEDSFEEVDAFFQSQASMARLSAMNDYVRYSTDSRDQDPWATGKPGIVIHQFNDESEREAVGADEAARTNIIMSFQ